MPRCLLDKSVARRIVEALMHLDRPSESEIEALAVWRDLRLTEVGLFIPGETVHTLARFSEMSEVRAFVSTVSPLFPGRYTKRWARRLTEHNFTREDALVISLASFGTDEEGSLLGVEWLATLDRPLTRNFAQERSRLTRRFVAMTSQLQSPYRSAVLPEILLPEDVSAQLGVSLGR